MNHIKQKVSRGVAWVAVGNWGNQLASFLIFIILTRLLTPEAFGLIGMATVFTAFMGLFSEQGFGQAIVQRKNLEDEHLHTAFWTNLAIGLALTLAGVLLSPVIARLYNEPQLTPVVAILSISSLLTALGSTQQALLERKLDFRDLSIRQLLAAIAGGIMGILAAILGAGVYALVIKTLTTGVVGVLLLWQIGDWRPEFKYSKKHFRELFHFGSNMVGIRITNFVRIRLDDFLIGYFLGPSALGYYVVAYRLGRLTLDMLTGMIGKVSISMFARLQDDVAKLRQAFVKTTKLISLITFPVFTGMITIAPNLVLLFSGEQWLPSILPMQILSIAGFTLTMQYICSYLIIATGKPALLLRINLVSTVATAIAFTLSAPFGINYVVLAYTLVNVSLFFIYLSATHRIIELNLRHYAAQMLWPAIASGIMALAVLISEKFLQSIGIFLWLDILIIVGAVILVYGLSIFVLDRSAFMDLQEIVLAILPADSSLHKRFQKLF